MTWVVGCQSSLGYAVLISDVQVTVSDKGTFDCLQKTFPLGTSTAAAFAGNVKTGFRVIKRLQSECTNKYGLNSINIEAEKTWFSRTISREFDACVAEQKLSAPSLEILISGIHPSQTHNVIDRTRITGPEHTFRDTRLVRFLSEDGFVPQLGCTDQFLSIGSGRHDPTCMKQLLDIEMVDSEIELWKDPIAFVAFVIPALNEILKNKLGKGISHVFQYAVCEPEKRPQTLNYDFYREFHNGVREEFRVNHESTVLAQDWTKLIEILQSKGLIEAALCDANVLAVCPRAMHC